MPDNVQLAANHLAVATFHLGGLIRLMPVTSFAFLVAPWMRSVGCTALMSPSSTPQTSSWSEAQARHLLP